MDAGSQSQIREDVRKDLHYLAQMLGELSQIARQHRAEMLCYFVEMAYAEAEDILAGKSGLSIDKPV